MSCTDLGPERRLEQYLSARIVIPFKEQQGAPFLCLGLARRIRGLLVQPLRTRIQPLRLCGRVHLNREVRAHQCDAAAGDGRRTGRVRAPLHPSELVPRILELSHSRERSGEVLAHRKLLRHRPGAHVHGQRVSQRRARRRIIPTAKLELTETMQRGSGLGPLLVRPPRRKRIPVQPLGLCEVSVDTRQAGEIDEVRRRDVVATVTAIQGQRSIEVPSRFAEITKPLRQQTEVVVVGCGTAGVADSIPQRQRIHVVVARTGEVAAVFLHAGERAYRVGGDAQVSNRGGERMSPLEV